MAERVLVVNQNGHYNEPKNLLMLKKYSYRGVEWYDAETPTPSDIEELARTYHLSEEIVRDVRRGISAQKIELHDSCIYVGFHFPLLGSDSANDLREISFIVGKDFLISVHSGALKPLHEISKIFDVSHEESAKTAMHAGMLLFFIMRHLYASLEESLSILSAELDQIEKRIFSGEEHSMVERISRANRRLLHLRGSLKPHENLLSSLESAGKVLFGEKYLYYISSIKSEWHKVWSAVEDIGETLDLLRQTNDSLLSTKTSDTMRALTLMALVTFPLTLLAGIFGMNAVSLPIVGRENDFWIILGIMASGTLAMVGFFKYRKWL